LHSFLSTQQDSGEREGGGIKAARSESGLCLYIDVWGTHGFIFTFLKCLYKTLLDGKKQCKNMKFKDFLWNSRFLINPLASHVLEY
jgi:hypothetical protein